MNAKRRFSMRKMIHYLKSPSRLLAALLYRYGGWIPDIPYTKIIYRLKMGKKLHLNRPQTYNEKIQWLKLYDRNPLYTTMVDKYAVKGYVENIIGKEYIIPTLGVWDTPDDIEWDLLPKSFVLKTTHGGGGDGVVVCKDKSKIDKNNVIDRLKRDLQNDTYKLLREWPYKNVNKRIIAEEYLEDKESKELRDYKFFCFNGVVRALFVATDRQSGKVKFDYFDENFNHLDIIQEHPMSEITPQMPSKFTLMKELASKLSENLPQVRVDLYECNGKVYFGELTFTHHGGITPFHPEQWDTIFGNWIVLPNKK